MNKNIEINGNMDLGAYSPLELAEEELNEELNEKAVSKAQRKFFGMVDAYKKGEMPDASPAIKKAADGMTKKQVKDFARTKEKGLPKHVNEATLRNIIRETLEVILEAKYVGNGILTENECSAILEEYGLSEIFMLNEDGTGNIFQKFRQPLASAISKIKTKFGNKPCQFISDVVKNAQAKGRNVLYGVLTAITLLSGTMSANAINTPDFEDSFQNSMAKATVRMAKERGISNNDELSNVKDQAVDDFIRILYTLDDDTNNRYCASGVGCAENEPSAINMAKQDVLNNLKQRYGEGAVQRYGLEFKTIAIQSWQEKTFVNGKPVYKSYYTAIIAAYQTIDTADIIRESVQKALVNVLKKYTQGKATSEEANKVIMNLANSSNNINEDIDERNNRSFYDYADEYMKKNGKKLPDEILKNAAKKNNERFFNRKK